MSRRELIVRGPVYFSQGDETAFFAWLESIPCIGDVKGRLRDLHIRLKRPPNNSDLRELIALLYRYRMNMKPLAAMRTSRNARWFDDDSKYWHVKVFGKRTRKPLT